MATYIMLGNWTDQGIRNITDWPRRIDAAKAAAKDAGGEIKDTYMTLGSHDLVVGAEFPSDEAAATFSLVMSSRGNVRLTTLKAFSEAEARKIIGSLP